MQNELRKLPADETNSQENSRDSQPLPARNVLFQKDSCKPDGDRTVQRTKNADHSDLLHLHSKIAEDKSAGIEEAHAQYHPARLPAWKTRGLFRNQDRRSDKKCASQTNHPHGLHGTDSRDDANSEQPKQYGKANRGENRPAHSAAAPAHSLSVVLVRCFFSARNNYDTHECANDPRDSHETQAFTRHPGKQERQSRRTGRTRNYHRHFPKLKQTVAAHASLCVH